MNRYKTTVCKAVFSIVFALCLCSSAILSVETKAADSVDTDILGTGTDYTAILYDQTNGLPTSEANAIVQSSDGFIWIGGYAGLIRYDGTDFSRFDSTTGISSVFSLLTDSKDRIWIGTNENGLALYDNGEITCYGRDEALSSYSVRTLAEDEDGNIIIGTTQGLAYADAKTLDLHPINDPLTNSEYITVLTKDAAGNIYGLTLDGDIFKMDGLGIGTFYSSGTLCNDVINTIYPDPEDENIMYMGTQGSSFLKVSVEDFPWIIKEYSTKELTNIKQILKVNDRYWVTSTSGIGYFDENMSFVPMDKLPMDNSVGNIMQDYEGNLWFTSTRQGVMKIVPDRFTDINAMADLPEMVVNTTCVRDGLLYIGQDEGLVIIDDDTYETVENDLTQMLDSIRIRCIREDSEGNLWICTHGDYGLVCYGKDESVTCYNSDMGLNSSRVRDIIQCDDGSMAVATGDGLYIIKNGEVAEYYGEDEGISTLEILCVEQGPDGRLYLGSDGDGIYVIDKGVVSRLSYDEGLTSGVIMRIKYDEKKDMFWLITSNSIEYMQEDTATQVSNFPYSNNLDIYFDKNDNAWILSSNGIYITSKQSLIDNGEIECSFYDTKSGLPYISTGNSRSYLSDDGHLYISGTTGLCKVNINSDDSASTNVLLTIPYVVEDDETIYLQSDDSVILSPDCKKLEIDPHAITFGLSNSQISYQLSGFDDSETVTTKQDLDTVSYTNLDGGKYTFVLNVIDSETGEVEKTLSLDIVKRQAIYETLWFRLLALVVAFFAIAAVLYVHFERKNARLKKKQEEDRKFINQIMHTFAKCVDLRDTQNQGHSFRVAYYTKMLAEKLAAKRGYSEEKIEEFYRIALLHDIGKINIPDSILNKKERLNDEEFEIMKTHAQKGEELLADVDIVPNLAYGAGYHHERLDGKGYPRGLKADEIPEVSRLIAVADTFDAMYSTRPYRKQMLLSDVIEELKRVKGTQLEEDVVDALVELADENKLDKDEVDRYIQTDIYHKEYKES